MRRASGNKQGKWFDPLIACDSALAGSNLHEQLCKKPADQTTIAFTGFRYLPIVRVLSTLCVDKPTGGQLSDKQHTSNTCVSQGFPNQHKMFHWRLKNGVDKIEIHFFIIVYQSNMFYQSKLDMY